jgi:two-component sensor histidine kinase
VVLTELLQNSIDHGFPEGEGGGNVVVSLAHDDAELAITVVDDGRGIAPNFDLGAQTGLGLSIVRTLVTTELAGSIEMRQASASELQSADLSPRPGNSGTVIELRVPLVGD